MNPEQEPLRIEIPVEDDEPFVPQEDNGRRLDVRAGMQKIGQGVGRSARKAWDSEARKQATSQVRKGVQKGVSVVAAKSAELLQERMVKTAEKQARQQASQIETQIRETDWRAEASKGASAGLRWASARLASLAERFTTPAKDPEEEQSRN